MKLRKAQIDTIRRRKRCEVFIVDLGEVRVETLEAICRADPGDVIGCSPDEFDYLCKTGLVPIRRSVDRIFADVRVGYRPRAERKKDDEL